MAKRRVPASLRGHTFKAGGKRAKRAAAKSNRKPRAKKR